MSSSQAINVFVWWQEELITCTEKLKDKENSLNAAEMEVSALNRRVQGLEGDLETCEDKLLQATQKLDKDKVKHHSMCCSRNH